MDHDDAIRSRYAERYVTGELSPEERDGFEEHFFDCPECAEEVRWEQIFAANARAVAREMAPARRPRFWESWGAWFRVHPALAFSAAGNAVLLIGLGLALLSGTRGLPPRIMPAYFAPPPSRAIEEPRALPAGTASIAVHFPVPEQKYTSYSYEILDGAGKREISGTATAPLGSETELYLEMPLSRLPAGVHSLVVRGDSGTEIVARLQFRTSH
jgi:hypothetical protein